MSCSDTIATLKWERGEERERLEQIKDEQKRRAATSKGVKSAENYAVPFSRGSSQVLRCCFGPIGLLRPTGAGTLGR
jgi:hypothetical protein